MQNTIKTMESLTSNQYYKGLNNRFDNRLKKLYRAGYKYNNETGNFEKRIFTYGSRKASINKTEIMHSDKRHFTYLLSQTI